MFTKNIIKVAMLGGLVMNTAAMAADANPSNGFLYDLLIIPNPNLIGQETYKIQTECDALAHYANVFQNFTTTQNNWINPQCSRTRIDVVSYEYPNETGTAAVYCSGDGDWIYGSSRYPTTITITSQLNPADNRYEPQCTIVQNK